jgi:hypothetical protein
LASEFDATRAAATTSDAADEFLGSPRRSDRNGARTAERRVFLDDFLGPAQGDELSAVLESKRLPWNRHAPFCGGPIIVPVEGTLPVVTLDGGMTLTLLGPVPARLHKLKTLWDRVRRGDEDHRSAAPSADYLRRGDEWPPVWRDGEKSDSSATNGSSIMLLAAFEGHEVLLSGDAHASDIAEALERVRIERSLATPLLLDAFKLAHHGSANNVTRAVLDQMDCGCFMVSTDGSTHGHPDNQALLRILRYSTRRPVLIFNYTSERTHRWGAKSVEVMRNFPLYTCQFPEENALGARLDLG